MKKLLSILTCATLALTLCFSSACLKHPEAGEVSLKYYADASELLPAMLGGNIEIGLLPEPAATTLTKKTPNKQWYRLNLGEIYDGEQKSYPQAVIMVKQSVLGVYPQIVESLKTTVDQNVEWAKTNTEQAVSAIKGKLEATTLTAASMTAEAISGCSIYYQDALSAKPHVTSYINDIIGVEPSSAKAVTDDFFYTGNLTADVEKQSLSFFMPDGAPALAAAKYINDNSDLGTGVTVNYGVVPAAQIGGKMQKGEGDIVIIPVNAATKLYKANANDAYQMVAVLTHGNLYIMSSTEITVSDLANKTVGVIGMGAVPDLTLKAALTKNNLICKTAV